MAGARLSACAGTAGGAGSGAIAAGPPSVIQRTTARLPAKQDRDAEEGEEDEAPHPIILPRGASAVDPPIAGQ